ncbi:MAG: hypothetical protein IT238_05020 [Bacteroidia bacterium]|nr:hypothetical protein [Bacteroidia bacterium]
MKKIRLIALAGIILVSIVALVLGMLNYPVYYVFPFLLPFGVIFLFSINQNKSDNQ